MVDNNLEEESKWDKLENTEIIAFESYRLNPTDYLSEETLLEIGKNYIGKQPLAESMEYLIKPPNNTTLIMKKPSELSKEEYINTLLPYLNKESDVRMSINEDIEDMIIIKKGEISGNKIRIYRDYILIDSNCACSVLRGSDIFSKGLMASSNFHCGDGVSIFYSPVKYKYGSKLKGGIEELSLPHYLVHVGSGIAVKCRKESVRSLQGTCIKLTQINTQHTFPIDLNGVLDTKLFIAINLGSALVAANLAAHIDTGDQPRPIILDMCAAPGGKTLHLASLFHPQDPLIIAIDKSKSRISRMKKNIGLYGFHNIRCFAADSSALLNTSLEHPLGTFQFHEELFDKILLDAPCSGLGIKPRLERIPVEYKDILSLAVLQRKLLQEAYYLLKKGGILSYSTCTFTTEENEANVRYAIDHIGFTLIKCPKHIAQPIINPILTQHETSLVQRLDITSPFNAFFLALFTK